MSGWHSAQWAKETPCPVQDRGRHAGPPPAARSWPLGRPGPGCREGGQAPPSSAACARGGRSGVGPGPWPSLTSAHLCHAPCPRPGRTESLVTVEQGNPRLGVGRPLQLSRARPCFHPSDLWLGARSELRHPSPVGCPPRAHVATQPLTARTACSRQELVSPPAEQDSFGSFCDPAPSDLP